MDTDLAGRLFNHSSPLIFPPPTGDGERGVRNPAAELSFSGEHMRPACGLQRPAATLFCFPNWQRKKREQNRQHCAKFAEAGRLSPHSSRVRSPEIAILNFPVRDEWLEICLLLARALPPSPFGSVPESLCLGASAVQLLRTIRVW